MFCRRIVTIFILNACLVLTAHSALSSETEYFPPYYKVYIRLGIQAFQEKDYESSQYYFQEAQMANPQAPEPVKYLGYIENLSNQAIESNQDATDATVAFVASENPSISPSSRKEMREVKNFQDEPENLGQAQIPTEDQVPVLSRRLPEESMVLAKRVLPDEPLAFEERQTVLYLNNELWATQPKTRIRLKLNSAVILEGEDVDRFLVVAPNFLEVEQLDRDRVLVKALRQGTTFLHLWDDKGRWTFHMDITYPIDILKLDATERAAVKYAENFRFRYDADWASFHTGPSLSDTERTALSFYQSIGFEGETPYGQFDSWAVYNRIDGNNELSGFGIGLTDGKIGQFENFTIRGFDFTKSFSQLSLAGQYMRGVLFEQNHFDRKLETTYVRGRNRETFGFLAPGLYNEELDSFTEAVRVHVLPEEKHNIAFNYARGWGEDRSDFLKDQVFSVEGETQLLGAQINSEIAYDQERIASTFVLEWDQSRSDVIVHFRDISPYFTTVNNLPGNQGEIGGGLNYSYRWDDVSFAANVDLYRDRLFFNSEDPRAVNIDSSASVDYAISPYDRWNSSVYYLETPGELSPRENLRLRNQYTKIFPVWGKNLTATFGGTFQRSRFAASVVSEYDRISFNTGLRYPLIDNLNYFANYEYSFVDELFSGRELKPRVFTTGLNYYYQFNDQLSSTSGLFYRDEQSAEGTNSFLAGEDSLSLNVGVNYRPQPDMEIFADGRMRNVWAETNDTAARHEVDILLGLRSQWELPYSWNPQAEIMGIVYKDRNGNGQYDDGEEGVPNVVVNVAGESYTTNDYGEYYSEVAAKRALVAVQPDNLPKGFVFSTGSREEVMIRGKDAHLVDFGLTTQSGIYGIVYYDINQNGKPDPGDELVGRVKLVLDGEKQAQSDFEGTYYFRNIEPGTHIVSLDVNSIPIDYLPEIKVREEIEVAEGSTYVYHVPLAKK